MNERQASELYEMKKSGLMKLHALVSLVNTLNIDKSLPESDLRQE